jgi:hypothetical protein
VHHLPWLPVTPGALGPVQRPLPRLKEHVLAVRQLPRQAVQDLVEGVTGLGGLQEQHGLLHRWVRKQPLLVQDHLHGNRCKDGVELRDIVLSHEDADLLPRDRVCKGEDYVVGNDHRDAAEHHGLQMGAPRGPAQRAQAEDRTLHVLVVGRQMVRRDVEQGVVLEVLPHRCAGAPALRKVGASKTFWFNNSIRMLIRYTL